MFLYSKLLATIYLFLMLTACITPLPKSGDGNTGTVTLNVGESISCYTVGACIVYLVMPKASGEYVVKQDGPEGKWDAGKFPADGQTVLLGKFYLGRTKFTIEGMDVPETWVSVVSTF